MKRVIGIDIETYDPDLKTRGTSWVYGNGYVICTSLYDAQTGKKRVYKGAPKAVAELMLNEDVVLIGHNIIYDIGWLEYELKIKTKAELLDTCIAEAHLDEYGEMSLDAVAFKYLKRGKTKSALEEWAEKEGYKGDFRKYLHLAPYELIEDYVQDDAMLPVLIYQFQEKLLKEQECFEPFITDCKLIKLCLAMKQRGVRIDVKKKNKNRLKLEGILAKLEKEFQRQYGNINLKSTKQLAELFEDLDIPYRDKITIKSDEKTAKGLFSIFRNVKGTVCAFVNHTHSSRVCRVLEDNFISYTCNASIDKKYLESIREEYAIVEEICAIKQAKDILSKFLGEEFDRFIVNGRIHCDFNIAKSDESGTISGRFSSSNPNLQQVSSKSFLFKGDEKKEVNLAKMCREIFIPEEGCLLSKTDYSQVEYRILTHYAKGEGAEEARRLFNENPDTDYHQFVMDLTGLERKFAKNLNFGVMYGMGIKTMAEAFGWSEEKAEELSLQYHSSMPYIKTTMEAVSERAFKIGYIKTIAGRRARLRYPKTGDEYTDRSRNKLYTFLNRLNQGSAADIMKKAMVMYYEEGLFDIIPCHITVHDELVNSIPTTEAGFKALGRLREIMETCYSLRVPLIAEPELGENWAELRDYKEVMNEYNYTT